MSDFKIINAKELAQMLISGQLCLVDVRTDAEVAKGKIAQGIPIPLQVLPLRLSELDENAPTVFYCQLGGRSAQAAAFASSHGFKDVYNLQGGIAAWIQADLPVSSANVH